MRNEWGVKGFPHIYGWEMLTGVFGVLIKESNVESIILELVLLTL